MKHKSFRLFKSRPDNSIDASIDAIPRLGDQVHRRCRYPLPVVSLVLRFGACKQIYSSDLVFYQQGQQAIH